MINAVHYVNTDLDFSYPLSGNLSSVMTGVKSSVDSVGDAYNNALAETINGLFKAEVIHRRGPWKGLDDVEYGTLEWVHWFNDVRLLETNGYMPPAEFETAYYTGQGGLAVEAGLK